MRTLPLTATQVVLILTLPLVTYFGYGAARKAMEIHELRGRAERLRLEIEQLQARHLELTRQREYLKTEQFVERVAREELGFIKPTEIPIVVVVKPDAAATSRQAAPLPLDQRSNPQRWWDAFFASR
ncbi:MAG: septum formation initiator family protein [Chloroflexota bacterium]|nr:septum formation initiator family protein [Dehalococcoidia bacterium]MDW8255256.1 septum formation initiator family protein [Chloroflexota bacterium]